MALRVCPPKYCFFLQGAEVEPSEKETAKILTPHGVVAFTVNIFQNVASPNLKLPKELKLRLCNSESGACYHLWTASAESWNGNLLLRRK